MIAVFLANGFEEIEALATVDILRRADLHVVTVGVETSTPVGAHNIAVKADIMDNEFSTDDLQAVILPGGMPGTLNLENSAIVQNVVQYAVNNHLHIGAICAAPSILGHIGLLQNKHATCYPGFEAELQGAILCNGVVTDGCITTACGAGVAIDFALELVRLLVSAKTAEEIRRGIQCR